MIQAVSTVMQLFKGSYLSVAAGLRHLWPNLTIANGTMQVNYVSSASKWSTKKSWLAKVYKWNVNYLYLDIDFNLDVCVIVFKKLEQQLIFFKLYRVNIIL